MAHLFYKISNNDKIASSLTIYSLALLKQAVEVNMRRNLGCIDQGGSETLSPHLTRNQTG